MVALPLSPMLTGTPYGRKENNMSCGCGKDKKIETQYLGDVAIDTLEDLPQYLLAERDVKDELSDDTVRSLVRIPTLRIAPSGNLDNVFAVVANNDSLEIPDGQVRAGTVVNLGSSYAVNYDDADNAAMFIMTKKDGNRVLAQNCGIINILEGHEYVLLQDYYASADGTGLPTTDSTSGVKLFTPISRTQLLVHAL